MFANGDIDSPIKAAQVLRHTGANGVMIGRAAQGRPWLCGQIASYLKNGELKADPSTQQQWQIIKDHLNDLHQFYGEYTGVRVARKHVGWYLQGAGSDPAPRQEFNRLESAQQQLDKLEDYFSQYHKDSQCDYHGKNNYKELAA